jgi:chorismate mutase
MNRANYPNIQVTDDQIDAFRIWATDKYENYRVYNESLKTEELTNYIRRHILSHEMKKILQKTDIYVGVRSNDPQITRLQISRQSILIKMCFLKLNLGRLAFAEEVAAIKAQQNERYREQNERYREQNERYREQNERYYRQRDLLRNRQALVDGESIPINKLTTRTIVQQKLADNEKQKSMLEYCAICFIKHNMAATCVIPCGHQFGSKCFASWKNNTCPLCRTPCMVVTEFVLPKQRRYFTDKETDVLNKVPRQVA